MPVNLLALATEGHLNDSADPMLCLASLGHLCIDAVVDELDLCLPTQADVEDPTTEVCVSVDMRASAGIEDALSEVCVTVDTAEVLLDQEPIAVVVEQLSAAQVESGTEAVVEPAPLTADVEIGTVAATVQGAGAGATLESAEATEALIEEDC